MMAIITLIATILLPPLGVALKHGLDRDFWINLILTLLGGIPGVLHALWVIASVDGNGKPAAAPMPTFIALCLSLFLPPVAAFMRAGLVAALINLVLCFFFWIPGVLHAVWVITQNNE